MLNYDKVTQRHLIWLNEGEEVVTLIHTHERTFGQQKEKFIHRDALFLRVNVNENGCSFTL